MAYTTDDLLSSIKSRGMLPDSINGLSSQILLDLATEELQLELMQMILSVREEFYVTKIEYPITAGIDAYRVPSRASGLVLRDTQVVSGTSIKPLNPIASESISTTQSGTPNSYYFQHDSVILYPSPSQTQDTLRLRYFWRPSRLALTSACGQITAIDLIGMTVTVSAIPSTWGIGTNLDFVSQTVPYTNVDINYPATDVTNNVITFASIPSTLTIGDWVAPAEYSPIAQVPQEFQVVLAQMACCRALEALGQTDQLQLAEAKLERFKMAAIELISPRNQGKPKKIINNSWSSRR